MKNGDILKGNCSWRKHLQAIRRHIRRKTSRCTVPCSASPLRCSKSAVDWKRRWDDTNSFPVAMKFELSGTDFSQLACQNCLWEMCDLLFGILQKKLCLVASNHSKKLTSQVFFKLQPWKWCQSFIEEIPSHANLRFPLLIQRFPAGSCYMKVSAIRSRWFFWWFLLGALFIATFEYCLKCGRCFLRAMRLGYATMRCSCTNGPQSHRQTLKIWLFPYAAKENHREKVWLSFKSKGDSQVQGSCIFLKA